MADSSLDDFFAKKDKNRKKSKTKCAASGDDDSSGKAVKKDKKKKEKERQTSTGGSLGVHSSHQEDEEWKDFEEEKKVDYTGLRIQTLQMSKDEQDKDGGDGTDNGDDEDENRDRRDGVSGPWNKSSGPASAVPAQTSQTELTKEESQPTPKAHIKYIPPAQRSGAMSTSSSTNLPSSRKKKVAPNVNSEEDFPTLGGAPGSGKWANQNFSNTGSSDLIENPNQRRSLNLTLENKFAALQD